MLFSFITWIGFAIVVASLIAWGIWIVNMISNLFLTLREPSSFVSYLRVEGEEVKFQSEDGIRLRGKFIRADGTPKGTVVFCQEVDGTMDSCSKYTSFLPLHGYHVFTFDFRGHGASENAPGYTPRQWVTSHELYDLLGALDAVRAMPEIDPDKIFLFGVSRGAAAAICTAAISNNIRGIVSDSAFSTKWLLNDYMRKWTGVIVPFKRFPTWVYWILEDTAVFAAEIKMQYRFPSVERALRTSKTPILMIHGQKDSYVSSEHARKLYDYARAKKKLLEVPHARHNESALVAPELYAQAVLDFLENVIPANRNPLTGSPLSRG